MAALGAVAGADGSPASGARLADVANGLVQAGAPGAVVVVRTPGGVRRAAAGVARIRPRVPLRAGDRYRIASVTKPFVATVVLQLEAEGRLRLDDPLERWLPGLLPGGREITLRMLLGHTSGLFDYDNDTEWVRERIAAPLRTWQPRELVAIAARHRRLFPPGTDWSYSNTNYVLLGLVVEAATKHTLRRELTTRVFVPLGLRSTSYPTGTQIPGPAVHGYLGDVPGLSIPAGRLVDVTTRLSPSAWGAGQIVSTADDVSRFFAALLDGRVLSPRQLREMKAEVGGTGPIAFTVPYGLGLDIRHTPCGTAYGHEGDVPGYRNAVWASSDGHRVAAVMVNVESRHLTWNTIREAVTAAFCSR
ncbi:MAG TPA: serine hydrolase domain-containing protein [Gaiella sp.]|nr:serine hydrolase domain-containing protein [Gaiella sp.]